MLTFVNIYLLIAYAIFKGKHKNTFLINHIIYCIY